jgi:hypothetical protein
MMTISCRSPSVPKFAKQILPREAFTTCSKSEVGLLFSFSKNLPLILSPDLTISITLLDRLTFVEFFLSFDNAKFDFDQATLIIQ